jgi:type III pantothenate kinase
MLLLDVGNSRIKWALVEGGKWSRQGAAGIAEWPVLQQVFATLPQPHKILVSNVAGDAVAQQVHAACAVWSCPVEFISARAEQCGVRNAYDQPAQLGSDRWAALIAAWHHERAACLVVSCGTATTIDALSGEGKFLGGLILPGVDMMRRSLAAGTAQLEAMEGSWREFPRNTADAMISGAIQASVGAILRQYELLGVPGARCLLSGGAADSVQSHLGVTLLRVDNLVLQGLQIIGQEILQRQGIK